ncbi:adenylyl-sulfate reductase subunit alpha [Sporomusa sphaeroides]
MGKQCEGMNVAEKRLETDILIIGGGTAGCFAAITIAGKAAAKVIIAEKANIKRSGCLAAGVNALNAYIVKGQTPETYLNYVKNDAAGVIREDLVYTAAERFNQVTRKMEGLGLVIQKDEHGEYAARGTRNIKINGENIKPLLAEAVLNSPRVTVVNRINIVDYIIKDGAVAGAYGFSLDSPTFYVISAKAVICATGGAAGLYRPNNPGFSRHKMWYSPFNTGAGYAMGIRAGAEMTTFEMRFIALRCKDTIAPTGTIAQGVGAPQVNSQGEEYEQQYGNMSTANRLYSTVMENRNGRGPCFLQTKAISPKQEDELYKAYLNMAPSQTLRWLERQGPASENVEIEGTEPYIVGGHTASGYWVDTKRATTINGLYAAGDVAGGCPQKYVTGCFAEGEIAALASLEYIRDKHNRWPGQNEIDNKIAALQQLLQAEPALHTAESIEEAMQKTMDDYAGGISSGYIFNYQKLQVAKQRIEELLAMCGQLRASDMYQLLSIQEVIDRLFVCKVLIRHLEARQETRWHAFQENADYPEKNDNNWLKYVNSRLSNGEIRLVFRDLVKRDEIYEHQD